MLTATSILQKINNKYFFASFICLLFLVVFQVFEVKLVEIFLHNNLHSSNVAYLQGLKRSTAEEFIFMTEIHALLATIESSNVGISLIVDANVQIGHEINSLTQLAENGKKYLEVSALASEITLLVIQLSQLIIPVLFKITGLVAVLFCVTRWKMKQNTPHLLFASLRLCIHLFVMLHLIVPYSVHLASASSYFLEQHYSTGMKNYARDIHSEYVGNINKQDNSAKAKSLLHKSETLSSRIGEKVSSFFHYISQYLLRIFLTNTVIPLILFVGLFFVSREFIGSLQLPEVLSQQNSGLANNQE